MRKLHMTAFAMTLALASQATMAVPETTPMILPPGEAACKKMMECIIEKSPGIEKNIPDPEHGGSREFKLVYQLAKQCASTTKEIRSMIGVMNQETQLRPHSDTLKTWMLNRLKAGDIKNDSIYNQDVIFENEQYKMKFYVIGLVKGEEIRSNDFHVSGIPSQNPFAVGSTFYGLQEGWDEVTGSLKTKGWWWTKDNIYFADIFHSNVGGSRLKGILILEKPIEIHHVVDECVHGG